MNKGGIILTKIFHWCFFALMTFLFVSSIFVTATHEKYGDGSIQEFAKVTSNNLPKTLLLLVLGVFLILLFYFLSDLILKKNIDTKIVAITVCAVAFLLSIGWIHATNIVPGADQAFCVEYAQAMNEGDFSSLEKGHYLANYPMLLGLVAFLRVLFKLFGDSNYEAFRYFNAIMVPVLIYSGYKVTGIISKKNRAVELFYLFFMLLCIPVYVFVLFVYGDLSGPAFGMLGFWMFFELLSESTKKMSWGKLMVLMLSVFFAIAFRKQTAIFAIAMVVVLLVRFIGKIGVEKFSKKDCAILVSVLLPLFFTATIVSLLYLPNRIDKSTSIPSSAWMTMGMNYDNGYAGWYNYYALDVHYANDCDTKATSAEAMRVLLKEYTPLFMHNPRLTIDFFFNKINLQWQSPLYQSIRTNNLLYGGQSDFVMSVYFGSVGEFFEGFMKMQQMLIYGCFVFLFIKKRKENVPIEHYAVLIATFGGFLLSVVWEAKGRYIFPYFIAYIPVYAVAAKEFYLSVKTVFVNRVKAKNKSEGGAK